LIQNILLPELTVFSLVQITIAFILLISIGILTFAKGARYRLWSIGWVIYTLSSVGGLLSIGTGFLLYDAIIASGMLFSGMVIYDGTKEKQRKNRQLLEYLIAPIFCVSIFIVAVSLNLSYMILYVPINYYTSFVCYTTVHHLLITPERRTKEFWSLTIGFLLLGISTTLYVLIIFEGFIDIYVFLIITSLVMTGVGMVTMFIQHTNDNLTVQYNISQIMTGALQHDIRNYVGSLHQSLHQLNESPDESDFWLPLSLEVADTMLEFINEMRHISASLVRFEAQKYPIVLMDVIDEIKVRVEREYNIDQTQIQVNVSKETNVMTSTLVKEILWNIIDNIFKHKGTTVIVNETHTSNKVVLEITDDAGGLPLDVQEFLNNSDVLSNPAAPGMGLGVILIRGMAKLSNIALRVENTLSQQRTGTIFHLEFEKAISVNA
jgi:signal transduction histidine kinase